MGRNTGSVLSHHIIQSFAPNEETAEQVHQAGLMLCDKLLKGKYQYVLTTHTDKDHIHNHIILILSIILDTILKKLKAEPE